MAVELFTHPFYGRVPPDLLQTCSRTLVMHMTMYYVLKEEVGLKETCDRVI